MPSLYLKSQRNHCVFQKMTSVYFSRQEGGDEPEEDGKVLGIEVLKKNNNTLVEMRLQVIVEKILETNNSFLAGRIGFALFRIN